MKTNLCIDCGISKSRNGIRCKSCAQKEVAKIKKIKGIKTFQPKRFNIDIDKISKMYIGTDITLNDIAKIYGCSVPTIGARLREGGINPSHKKYPYRRRTNNCLDCGRSIGAYHGSIRCRDCNGKSRIGKHFLNLDNNKIVEMYTIDKLSSTEIAKSLGCHHATIISTLSFMGIKRDFQIRKRFRVHLKNIGFKKGCKCRNNGKTYFKKGHKINVGRKMKPRSLQTRIKSSANLLGIKVEDWIGFSKNFYYGFDFTKRLRIYIKKRDKFICQSCGIKTQRLDVHHINYIKKDCSEINLISLCKSCHCRTNFNREYWENFLKMVMFNKMFFRKYLTFRNIKDVKTDIEHYIINQDLKRIK